MQSIMKPRLYLETTACSYEIDYLVTWNCAHIANAEIRRRLTAINATIGRQTPTICTPEELMGMEEV